MTRLAFAAFALFVATGLVACGGAGKERSIVYRVTGTGTAASLTYENESGGTEQRDVTLPWTYEGVFEVGDFLYISAQSRDSESRRISCEITQDGDRVEEASSEGRFVIASCSGSVE